MPYTNAFLYSEEVNWLPLSVCKIVLRFIFLLKLFRSTSSTNLVSAFFESENDKKDLSLGIKKRGCCKLMIFNH